MNSKHSSLNFYKKKNRLRNEWGASPTLLIYFWNFVMKSNSNFKMDKSLKILLSKMNKENREEYKREMIQAIIAPRIEFKKKKKEETQDD